MSGRRKKQQRIMAVLLCLILLSAFMLCAMMGAKHALHHCYSTNCYICEVLQNSQHAAKQLVLAVSTAIAITISCALMLRWQRNSISFSGNSCCLVNLKIRNNN